MLYAEDISHYGAREIDAANDGLALARAMDITPEAMRQYTDDPDHDNPRRRRIVHIEGPDGTVAEGIYLDPDDRLGVFAHELAQALASAITAMNAIPSFDTRIPNPDHPNRTLCSYELLARLEAILSNARSEQ